MSQLMDGWPGLHDSLPCMQLTTLPTPLDSADRLSAKLGLNRLWIKRDDLCAEPYGGNKVRKLEHLLADALQKNCDAVVTYGAAGSNHALATSIYARRAGLDCYAVLTEQPPTPKVAQTLRYHALLGTKLVAADGFPESLAARDALMASHPTGADKVYDIWWGGSSWLGATGFVNAALELGQQLAGDPPEFVYVAAGTLGTAVGLALGLRLLDWSTQLVAVRVVPVPKKLPASFEKLYRETNTELRARDAGFPVFDDPEANFELRDEFLGPGYAIPAEGTQEAVDMGRELAGITLETTYSGKAMAGLIHDARSGRLEGRSAVFWLTYNSQPYPDELEKLGPENLPEAFRPYF